MYTLSHKQPARGDFTVSIPLSIFTLGCRSICLLLIFICAHCFTYSLLVLVSRLALISHRCVCCSSLCIHAVGACLAGMGWLWLVMLVGIAVAVVRTAATSKARPECNGSCRAEPKLRRITFGQIYANENWKRHSCRRPQKLNTENRNLKSEIWDKSVVHGVNTRNSSGTGSRRQLEGRLAKNFWIEYNGYARPVYNSVSSRSWGGHSQEKASELPLRKTIIWFLWNVLKLFHKHTLVSCRVGWQRQESHRVGTKLILRTAPTWRGGAPFGFLFRHLRQLNGFPLSTVLWLVVFGPTSTSSIVNICSGQTQWAAIQVGTRAVATIPRALLQLPRLEIQFVLSSWYILDFILAESSRFFL